MRSAQPDSSPGRPGSRSDRKIRLSDPTSGKGKSGGRRVLYAFFAEHGIILLIAAWPKAVREDLKAADYKAIGILAARIARLLDEGRML